jgi:LAGLIDADG endonuclease
VVWIESDMINVKALTSYYYSTNTKSSARSAENINPYYISGYTDAEGCFGIEMNKSKIYKSSWNVSLRFTITSHKKDIAGPSAWLN